MILRFQKKKIVHGKPFRKLENFPTKKRIGSSAIPPLNLKGSV